jgi:hypothetical protein
MPARGYAVVVIAGDKSWTRVFAFDPALYDEAQHDRLRVRMFQQASAFIDGQSPIDLGGQYLPRHKVDGYVLKEVGNGGARDV